jgi:predicted DNA-binding transcriptional regulator AlpA
MKTCSTCKQSKPLSDFYRASAYKDGHAYECKACRKVYLSVGSKLPRGRPKALNENKQQRAVSLYNEGVLPIKEICQMMGISKPTLYTYVHGRPYSRSNRPPPPACGPR